MIFKTLLAKQNRSLPLLLTAFWVGSTFGSPLAQGQGQLQGQGREEQSVRDSITVLSEIMTIPTESIPRRLLAGAEGVAIIPKVIKGGFIIGARRGRGTLLVRNENGGWHAPVFVTLTGGSIGWQAGIQSTDVILVFKTKKSIQGVLSKKFTLGVDAAAAVGPVGRQASASTDVHLQAEIYSYARSRGLFLGASLDGSMLQVDGMANAAYYQSAIAGQPAVVPASALQLVQLVASYNTAIVAPVQTAPEARPGGAFEQPVLPSPQAPTLALQHATHESDVIRGQLSKTSPELFERLDPAWSSYLALPSEVFSQQSHPTLEAIQKSLQNYDKVQKNPQYQTLSTMPAFQSTYGLLKHYESTLSKNEVRAILPPPPSVQ